MRDLPLAVDLAKAERVSRNQRSTFLPCRLLRAATWRSRFSCSMRSWKEENHCCRLFLIERISFVYCSGGARINFTLSDAFLRASPQYPSRAWRFPMRQSPRWVYASSSL